MDNGTCARFVVAIGITAWCSYMAPEVVTSSHITDSSSASAIALTGTPASRASTDAPARTAAPAGENDGAVDVYGNDVTAAVAQYKLDATGSLYEVHAPQTALARLAPPKS